MNPYDELMTKKREWTPVQPSYEVLTKGTEDLIARALAMRILEIPVGNFIKDACGKELPAGSKEILLSNIQDEVKHDQALNYAADSFPMGVLPDYSKAAASILKAWIDAPEHPVLKAMTLERGVFFIVLPILRFYGNTALRTVSGDISRDEQIHVLTNSLYCRDFKIALTPNLEKLRRTTVAWMTQHAGLATKQNNGEEIIRDQSFWLRQSDALMSKGVAPELQDTRRAVMPAFFERSNQNLPNYSI
jgi:hypothetical protein